ncbi:hypothetical protein [Leucobacter coleopterorum]|uniref:hypothetical protein n=1 Tax=Leucobacter coleopterorum TaxID=2714933 RepID=UPI001FCB6FBF|nr:hypothetical protein [Leucobacter coleopterorum]
MIGLVALAAAMVVIISAGSSVVNTIWDTRMAELADEEEKLNASFPSDVDAMNVAMQSGDREAFIAAGEKEGVEQLARLWDETKKIGWKTGVVTGGGYADEDHDERRVSMMFSFDLGFELDDATGDEINGGTSMLHGFEYVVNLGEYTEGEGGYGRGRLIQSIEPVIPMPWDSPDGVYAARTEHAVAFGAASDREYIDARSAAAERAATFVLDTLAPSCS